MWGGSVQLAYTIQLALALALAASLARLWRSDAAFELKAAALSVASLLATPYVLDYDLVVAGIAIAYLARLGLACGFRDYEISLLAVTWLAPLLTRSVAQVTAIPLALLTLLTLYGLILRRAALDREEVTISAGKIAHA